MVSEPSIRGISSMKMVWAIHGGSSCGQCPDQYGRGVHGGGARHLFDEMPSHREATLGGVLRVTVSQVLYPMNEEVLHQVFDAYGAEQVVVLKRADHVEALVRFRSSRDAERARDVTHGHCVYDGCCWLDVQYMQPTPSDSVVATPATCSTLGLSHNTDDITWDEEPKASPSPEAGTHIFEQGTKDHPDISNTAGSLGVINVYECSGEMNTIKESGENIYYDCPLREQTGIWVPPSVPPMTKHDHEEWKKGFVGSNGGYFPEEEYKWDIDEKNKEMAMWDVLAEMVVAGKDKVLSIASYDFGRHSMSLISYFFLQEVLKDKAQTLVDASAGSEHALLETEPTKWLPDSAAPSCMLCGAHFHPIICSRHHCHFCGGIFCAGCSKGRSLMPPKFRTSDPHRVCDVCGVRLECIQPYLMNQISRACQLPTNDLTDLSTLRSWLNFPWAHTMEYEIYKAANSIHGYCKVGKLTPEKSIPDSILRQAKGLAIITVVKVGMLVTYKIGTGLVVARRADGSWSPPSAISTCGVGYGAQAGGEIADFIIVLRNTDAIKTFSGNAHLSVGAGISASAGHLGRVAEADFRAGDGGYAACYTYSCSKGAFVGCALNGSVVSTRNSENARFYGGPIKASEILLGSLARPPAAATLYKALSILFAKIEN